MPNQVPQKGQFWHFDTIDELNANKYEYLNHCKDWYMHEGLNESEARELAFEEYQIKLSVMMSKVKPAHEQFFSGLNAYLTPPKRGRGRPRKG